MLWELQEHEKMEILEIASPQKNGSNFPMPDLKSMIIVWYCWKNNGLTNETKNNDMFLIILKKLTIIRIPFFLGHPVLIALMVLRFLKILS